MYKHYVYYRSALDKISIYEYLQFIFLMKYFQQQNTNYKFDIGYRRKRDYI